MALMIEISFKRDYLSMGNCCIGGEEGADMNDAEDRQTVSGQLQEQQRAWQVRQSDV